MTPLKKSLTVPLDQQSAFDLFIDGIDKWWPTESHSLSASNDETPLDVTFERKEGGYVTETLPDGQTARWATVLVYDPGHKVVLSWYVGRDESEATEVTVVFNQTEAGTRVDLTHGGFAALGDAADTMSAQYDTGWDLVLGRCFGGACQKVAA